MSRIDAFYSGCPDVFSKLKHIIGRGPIKVESAYERKDLFTLKSFGNFGYYVVGTCVTTGIENNKSVFCADDETLFMVEGIVSETPFFFLNKTVFLAVNAVVAIAVRENVNSVFNLSEAICGDESFLVGVGIAFFYAYVF